MNKLNLFRYFKRYSFLYLIAIVAMSAGTLLDQAAPLIVQHIIDDVLIAKKMEVLNLNSARPLLYSRFNVFSSEALPIIAILSFKQR